MLEPLLGVLGSCRVVLASFGITRNIPGCFLTIQIPSIRLKPIWAQISQNLNTFLEDVGAIVRSVRQLQGGPCTFWDY